jgi:cytochrome c-type biogenesis protein CcsB
VAFGIVSLTAIGGQTTAPSPPAVATAGKGEFLKAEWREALKPLRTLPIQTDGFIRSAATFSNQVMLAVRDDRSFRGQPSLVVVLWALADPGAARNASLLKVDHPDLVNLFGGKRISLATYRDSHLFDRMRELYASNQERYLKPCNRLEGRAQRLEELPTDLAIVPRTGEWLSPAELGKADPGGAADPLDVAILAQWESLTKALRGDDPEAGAKAASGLVEAVAAAADARRIETPHLRLDALYQEHHPFAKSAFFYLFAALFYGASLLFGPRWAARAGYAFLVVGFGEEVFGVVCRWILSGRAPLANMYESFTFATAGMILVALIFEFTHKIRLAGLGGAVLGFIFMTLAHKAPIFDTKIAPLMPALQSSWLTYHVVTIMLSYSAFALSFFVSVCYLGKDMLGGDASRLRLVRRLPSLPTLDIFNYKIIAVGFPLLTVGIILGAVWANTAWGRPWGFDPKETWSAITWLVYALYLHVRFLSGWRGRWAAVLALLGFLCVLFTYLGVNYLLPGLHSYV